MADPLYTELVKRNPSLVGGAAAKIGAKPAPSTARTVLEMLTGYPADPDRDMGPIETVLASIPMAGGSKLAMDKASRMARATEQGYTTPVWHGTTKSFSEFSGPIRNDRGDFGIHVATDPETASRATGMSSPMEALDGKNVMPLLARINNSFDIKDIGLWKTPDNWLGYPGIHAMGKTTNDPDMLKQILSLAEQHRNPRGVVHDPVRVAAFQRDMLEAFQKKGYDSVRYPNHIEGRGEPSYMLLDPTQLRSIFAAFDPARKNSRDLLAGIGGAGVAASMTGDK